MRLFKTLAIAFMLSAFTMMAVYTGSAMAQQDTTEAAQPEKKKRGLSNIFRKKEDTKSSNPIFLNNKSSSGASVRPHNYGARATYNRTASTSGVNVTMMEVYAAQAMASDAAAQSRMQRSRYISDSFFGQGMEERGAAGSQRRTGNTLSGKKQVYDGADNKPKQPARLFNNTR